MKSPARKHVRFYVVNPASDRRLEQRFESREDVVIRFIETGKVRPGVASDIGRTGLRLAVDGEIMKGDALEVVFPSSSDGVRCFARVAWTRAAAGPRDQEAGVAIEGWFGIILGGNSWLRFKNGRIKKDRRSSPR